MRGLSRGGISVVVLTVLAALLLPVPEGQAQTHTSDPHGWQGCSWAWRRNQGQPIFFAVDANWQFPPGKTMDGQFFSFTNRLLDGAGEWNNHLAGRVSHSLRVNAVGGYADVSIQYIDTQATYGDSIGWTDWYASGGCVTHADNNGTILGGTLRMNPRADWYTAPNRGTWETNCAALGSYSCARDEDFQSAFSHEMFHSFGLVHPGTVDAHHGQGSTGGTAYNVAECSNPAAARTACPGGYRYRTAKRTVEPYDTETLFRSYQAY